MGDVRYKQVPEVSECAGERVERWRHSDREAGNFTNSLQLDKGKHSRFDLEERSLIAGAPQSGFGRLLDGKALVKLIQALLKISQSSFKLIPISRVALKPFRFQIDFSRTIHRMPCRLDLPQPFGHIGKTPVEIFQC